MSNDSTITPRTLIRDYLTNNEASESILVAERHRSLRQSPARSGSISMVEGSRSLRRSSVGNRRSSLSDISQKSVIKRFLETQTSGKPVSRKRKYTLEEHDGTKRNPVSPVAKARRSSRIQPPSIETPGKDLTPRTVIGGFLRQALEETPIQSQRHSDGHSLPPIPPEAELLASDSPLNVTSNLKPRRSIRKFNSTQVTQHAALEETPIQSQCHSDGHSLPPIPPEAELLASDSPLNVTSNLKPRRSIRKFNSTQVKQHTAQFDFTLGSVGDDEEDDMVIPETQHNDSHGSTQKRHSRTLGRNSRVDLDISDMDQTFTEDPIPKDVTGLRSKHHSLRDSQRQDANIRPVSSLGQNNKSQITNDPSFSPYRQSPRRNSSRRIDGEESLLSKTRSARKSGVSSIPSVDHETERSSIADVSIRRTRKSRSSIYQGDMNGDKTMTEDDNEADFTERQDSNSAVRRKSRLSESNTSIRINRRNQQRRSDRSDFEERRQTHEVDVVGDSENMGHSSRSSKSRVSLDFANLDDGETNETRNSASHISRPNKSRVSEDLDNASDESETDENRNSANRISRPNKSRVKKDSDNASDDSESDENPNSASHISRSNKSRISEDLINASDESETDKTRNSANRISRSNKSRVNKDSDNASDDSESDENPNSASHISRSNKSRLSEDLDNASDESESDENPNSASHISRSNKSRLSEDLDNASDESETDKNRDNGNGISRPNKSRVNKDFDNASDDSKSDENQSSANPISRPNKSRVSEDLDNASDENKTDKNRNNGNRISRPNKSRVSVDLDNASDESETDKNRNSANRISRSKKDKDNVDGDNVSGYSEIDNNQINASVKSSSNRSRYSSDPENVSDDDLSANDDTVNKDTRKSTSMPEKDDVGDERHKSAYANTTDVTEGLHDQQTDKQPEIIEDGSPTFRRSFRSNQSITSHKSNLIHNEPESIESLTAQPELRVVNKPRVSLSGPQVSPSPPESDMENLSDIEASPTQRTQYAPVKTPQTLQMRKKGPPVTPLSGNRLSIGRVMTSTPKPVASKAKVVKSAKKAPQKKNKKVNNSALQRMPSSLTKGIFSHFLKLPISKDVMEEVDKITDKFWKNVSDDLEAFAHHAGRTTIMSKDVELLMRRQGFITEKRSMFTLVDQYLPLEYRQEIIPIARSGNKVMPQL